MNILDGIENAAPIAAMVSLVVAIVAVIIVLAFIGFRAAKNASYKRWQSKQGIPSKSQWGKSNTFYRTVAVGLVALIALGGVFGWKVITGLVGDSSGTSTVQTSEVEER